MGIGPKRQAAEKKVLHRALLVEDHPDLAAATAEFLRFSGLEVRVASCGQDALVVAAAFRPEIVLCDMRLPDMTGLKVLQTLRPILNPNAALLVLHTVMSEVDIRLFEQHEDASSVNLFLSKPITQEKLDLLLSKLENLPGFQPK